MPTSPVVERVVAGVLSGEVARRSDIADEIRQQRTGEVRMVEDVEELSAELQIHMLGKERCP